MHYQWRNHAQFKITGFIARKDLSKSRQDKKELKITEKNVRRVQVNEAYLLITQDTVVLPTYFLTPQECRGGRDFLMMRPVWSPLRSRPRGLATGGIDGGEQIFFSLSFPLKRGELNRIGANLHNRTSTNAMGPCGRAVSGIDDTCIKQPFTIMSWNISHVSCN